MLPDTAQRSPTLRGKSGGERGMVGRWLGDVQDDGVLEPSPVLFSRNYPPPLASPLLHPFPLCPFALSPALQNHMSGMSTVDQYLTGKVVTSHSPTRCYFRPPP